jgi:NO-binding membrane sensor protein with MHYT domain
MVQYADFHALAGTLSPVFFFAALVAHFRVAKDLPRGQAQAAGWALLGMSAAIVAYVTILALVVLAGFAASTPDSRLSTIALITAQVIVTLAVLILDLIEGRRQK